MENRKEIIYTDLGSLCQPAENISQTREHFKWNSVFYETKDFKGHMLISLGAGTPDNVTFTPNLQGWYRIFVGQPLYWFSRYSASQSDLLLRLDNQQAFEHFSHSILTQSPRHRIQEAYWCCADMTDRSVVIGKHKGTKGMDAGLAWLRFVPMSDTEVAAFQSDQLRTDTKRIYATNDMHGMICKFGYQSVEDWYGVVQDYNQSDVEWLSLENIGVYDGDISTGDSNNFAYPRPVDKRFQQTVKTSFTHDMLRQVVKFGHEKGLKMCVSMRMGPWCMELPYDQMYHENSFYSSHPQLRCIDRDGTAISALSYMYAETQDYVISQLVELAKLGLDAVELMACRGNPYILFEKPFVDLFTEEYGEDPRFLPQDDDRIISLKCDVFTNFFRRLRAALDQATGKGTTRIHLRGMYCIYDTRYIGLDPEALASEGLINAFLSYPQRVREILADHIWKDEDHTHLDLSKYHDYALESSEPIISRKSNLIVAPPMADSRGIMQGPVGLKERVDELMALEKKYGIPVYLDVFPRVMPPLEFRDRILEMYQCGVERFSLWDTYDRVPFKVNWSLMRQIGHKEKLADYRGEGEYYSYHRVLKYGESDVSRYYPSWGG